MTALWSKVERRLLRDEKCRELSEPAWVLWVSLLITEQQNVFPGLYVLVLTTAAHDVRHTVEAVEKELQEIIGLELACYDPKTSVVWLPNAIRKRLAEIRNNKKNARAWRNVWDGLPRCEATRRAFWAVVDALEDTGGPGSDLVVAFRGSTPPAWVIPRPRRDRALPWGRAIAVAQNPKQLRLPDATPTTNVEKMATTNPRIMHAAPEIQPPILGSILGPTGVGPTGEEEEREYQSERRERVPAASLFADHFPTKSPLTPVVRDGTPEAIAHARGASSCASTRLRLASGGGTGDDEPESRRTAPREQDRTG